MEFCDLNTQQKRIAPHLRERMDAVLEHGHYIMGPEVAELEQKLAAYCGAKHCIACASGSTALDLVLAAWGIGPGDAVLTTPFTFAATAESIARIGAVPIFVDIEAATFNMNIDALAATLNAFTGKGSSPLPRQTTEQKLTLRAILTVDMFGRPADYAPILSLAQQYGLKVLEDGAQGFGGVYQGKPLCACGCDASATSFFPTKPLGCYGDGGAVFTDNDELAALVNSLRYHGRADAAHKYDNARLGFNGRIDTLQAAILLAKFDVFADEVERRGQVAALYNELLAGLPIILPQEPIFAGTSRSVWAQYTVLLPEGADRPRIVAAMKNADVPTAIHYPKGLHRQQAFAYLGYQPEDFPVTESVCSRVLSLPMHPYLNAADQLRAAKALGQAMQEYL